ncbi:MAG: hypothetical protein CMJ64_14485 [Planctomycetaceae bacterium]|nr:hypothetical protein [Planctomycetaceae bacterium]
MSAYRLSGAARTTAVAAAGLAPLVAGGRIIVKAEVFQETPHKSLSFLLPRLASLSQVRRQCAGEAAMFLRTNAARANSPLHDEETPP